MKFRFLAVPAILASLAASGAAAVESNAKGPALVGVNISGAEFNGKKRPGVFSKDYIYPDKKTIDYFIGQGMTTIRLPFLWERLQPNLNSGFDAAELSRLDATVGDITGRGAHVIIDPHNYGHYSSQAIGTDAVPDAAFAAFWKNLAGHYKGNERVIFGLMNEPHGIGADTWAASAQAAINAIRASGARNLILVPGTAWTGAHTWMKQFQGVSNADALARVKDSVPGGLVVEVHQYLDKDSSGTKHTCVSETTGVDRLRGFTEWLRKTGARGFLGEFAAGPDPMCLKALDNMLDYIDKNADVWAGWTYWAAGPWWGKYPFSVQPDGDTAKPQMEILLKHVPRR